MDATRFAELVQSLHEAGQIARGQRKPLSSSANPHVGSDFEDFLAEEGWLSVTNVSQAELARHMRTSRAVVHRLLDATDPSVTLATISKAATALGRSVRVALAA